jgi:hypothetical protein
MNKVLKRLIGEILFTLDGVGYYPMITYIKDDTNSIRFYLDPNNKVKKELFITNSNEIIRKTLTEEEIKWCLDNIDSYTKYKRVGC